MKKSLVLSVALAVSSAVFSKDTTIVVTGDRVSLRAAPDSEAVLMGRAMIGEELILKDNTNPDWVGVLPPGTVDLWVNTDFVSNSIVSTKQLNIRSGPSLSHSVVGSARRGDELVVRGEMAEWLKIAPTPNTMVWISRKYVEAPSVEMVAEAVTPVIPIEVTTPVQSIPVEAGKVAEPGVPETPVVTTVPVLPETPVVTTVPVLPETPVVTTVAVVPETAAVVKQPFDEISVQQIMAVLSPVDGKPLSSDSMKQQGSTAIYTGLLVPESALLYKLTDDRSSGTVICYVRGNSVQMKQFSGSRLKITGKIYWAFGLDLPVIVPARIMPLGK